MTTTFARNWYTVDLAGHRLDLPGIYEWRIDGTGVYIGKSMRLRKRFDEYPNNVRKLMMGLPYRKSKPDGFRMVHRRLDAALGLEKTPSITLTVLENCPLSQLQARENFWIGARRKEAAAGGLQVLNST